MSSLRTEIGMDLSIYRSLKSTVRIELKYPESVSFVCQVKGFLYEAEDTQVEFTRVAETFFPNDTNENKEDTYITFIKDVKKVEEVK